MKKILTLIVSLCALGFARDAAAQYYTWGSDAPMKWSTIRTPDVRVIYPDTVAAVAHRTLHYIRAVQPDIAYGFRHGAMRIPFVMHPENFRSNGLVMYLPKRVEFLTSPRIDGYSMPWVKQLVAHEYRHAVQYNNLNRGLVRALSYVLGQQGSTIGLLFMPIWAMEGDATISETMMSTYGRGLQPSFSMGYRAIGRPGSERRNIDRWFCGSYRDYIPDHYELGYQICSYAYDHFGENVWDKVVRYSVRNPYVIATTRIAMGKYYKTNVGQLFHATFDDLDRYWSALPPTEERVRTLRELPDGNYTTYQWPQFLDDTTALAVRSDYERPARFVRLDTRTGEEQVVAYTGSLSSRPALGNGCVWWTEYRRSKLFEQRVHSQLCYMNLADGRTRTVNAARHALYPTSAGDDFAWVQYSPDGRYTVCVRRADGREERYEAPFDREIHGLAWDDVTIAFYVLVTDNRGMWIGRIDAGGLHEITQPAYITLSDLRAGEGKLWFGSIASGKDEVHGYDLMARREYRLTSSTYGSFAPGADATGSRVLVTTYDRRGYRVAEQPLSDTTRIVVSPAQVPVDLVNPPRKRWDVVNLDTVDFTAADSVAQHREFRDKRYRKGPNLMNIHSWMPVAFDPFSAVDEQNVTINLGATFMSQNLLSNTEAFASYGWNSREGSLYKMGVKYFGLGVHFDFDFDYGGNQLFYELVGRNPSTGEKIYQTKPAPEKYYSVGLSALLPLYFQRGYHTRQLSISTGWSYSNGLVANMGKINWNGSSITNIEHIGFKEGLHKLSVGIGFSDQVRMAHRDFAPRWSYLVSANYTFNPANEHFSDLISLYAQTHLPGVAPHHSLRLAANYQTSIGGYKYPSGYPPLSYRSTRLIPRGFNSSDIMANHYTALSLDYQLPIWYPEGGLGSLLYFKRIRLGVGGDYAQFRNLIGAQMGWQRIWAVGGDIIFDVNLFRQPSSATSTFKLSVYYPSSGSVSVSAGVGFPF